MVSLYTLKYRALEISEEKYSLTVTSKLYVRENRLSVVWENGYFYEEKSRQGGEWRVKRFGSMMIDYIPSHYKPKKIH